MFSVLQLCMEPTLYLWALFVLVIHVEGTDYVVDAVLRDQVTVPGRGWGLLLYFMLTSVLNSSHVMDIGCLSSEVNFLDDICGSWLDGPCMHMQYDS